MSRNRGSYLKIPASPRAHGALAALSPKALQLLLHLAKWSALWNYAGLLPKDIIETLCRPVAFTSKSARRLLAELHTAKYHFPAAVLDEDPYNIRINPEVIGFGREGDWDRTEVPKVTARDKNRCRYCGVECYEDLTIDHVFPRSRGGSDNWRNLVVACNSCNSRKSDRTPEEAGMQLLPEPTE